MSSERLQVILEYVVAEYLTVLELFQVEGVQLDRDGLVGVDRRHF